MGSEKVDFIDLNSKDYSSIGGRSGTTEDLVSNTQSLSLDEKSVRENTKQTPESSDENIANYSNVNVPSPGEGKEHLNIVFIGHVGK
jgi:hypothetical protein